MGLNKFFDIMKINSDDDDDYYSEYDDDDSYGNEKPSFIPGIKQSDESDEDKPVRRVVKANNYKKKGPTGNMEVVRIKPTNVDDGRKITTLLLENKVVFLDLEDIENKLAQRIVDFVSGASFAIDGTLQQMSNYTFVITPPAVVVSGDFQEGYSDGDPVTF